MKYHWHSIDIYFQDGAGSVWHLFLTLLVATTAVLEVCKRSPVWLPRSNTKNRWHSIDTNLHDGTGSMSVLFLPRKAANTSTIATYVTKDIQPTIVNSPLTLVFRMGQWQCHLLFCQVRIPVRWLWIAATRSLFDYCTYTTINRWRAIDAYFQNGATSMLLLFLTWKTANTWFRNVCNQSPLRLPEMYRQKLLTLCWRTFSEWGSDRVVYSCSKKGCQDVSYG